MIETTTEGTRHRNGNERSLATIIAEIKEELKQFVHTRVQMVKAELQETKSVAKIAIPLVLIALVLFATAFLLLTMAVVVLVASVFAGNPLAWFYAAIIVGVLWLCIAGICVFFAYNAFRSHNIFPRLTIQVLKADKVMLQTEARSHI